MQLYTGISSINYLVQLLLGVFAWGFGSSYTPLFILQYVFAITLMVMANLICWSSFIQQIMYIMKDKTMAEHQDDSISSIFDTGDTLENMRRTMGRGGFTTWLQPTEVDDPNTDGHNFEFYYITA